MRKALPREIFFFYQHTEHESVSLPGRILLVPPAEDARDEESEERKRADIRMQRIDGHNLGR